MLSLQLSSSFHLYRSLRQLQRCPGSTLNAWRVIPCTRTVWVHTSTTGKRRLATSPEKPRKTPHVPSSFRLRTLRPERLSAVGQEIVDLSGKACPVIRTVIDGCELHCPYKATDRGSRHVCYPENTRGFFYYYHAPPTEPELNTGVRFRLCDSADAFAHGRDLLYPKGDVWGPKILELARYKTWDGFVALARAEHLIDGALFDDLSRVDLPRNLQTRRYSLAEPLLLNLAWSTQQLHYITRARLVRLYFTQRVFSVRCGSSYVAPLTGSIKVQFEPSALPEHKELGPTLVLRVLDIVKPITVDPLYEGNAVLPIPVAGTLLHHRTYKGRIQIVHLPLKAQPMADDLLALMKAAWA